VNQILGVITARGGSKGIPRKNLVRLAGKPLVQWTVEAALGSKLLTRLILSTDDPEIAALARELGVDVPFMRPEELSTDDAPTVPVLQHAVDFLERKGFSFDAICLLQPTSPLRKTQHINDCIEMLFEENADAVVSVLTVPHQYNPHWVYLQNEDATLRLSTAEREPIPRRQLLPPAFHRDGSVYVVRRDVLMEQNSLFGQRLVGYPLDSDQAVNIDSAEQLAQAEELLLLREE